MDVWRHVCGSSYGSGCRGHRTSDDRPTRPTPRRAVPDHGALLLVGQRRSGWQHERSCGTVGLHAPRRWAHLGVGHRTTAPVGLQQTHQQVRALARRRRLTRVHRLTRRPEMPVYMQFLAVVAFIVGLALLSVGKKEHGMTALVIMWVIVIFGSFAQPGSFM
jgi:hypothetical protein